jgi:hypothetical protein
MICEHGQAAGPARNGRLGTGVMLAQASSMTAARSHVQSACYAAEPYLIRLVIHVGQDIRFVLRFACESRPAGKMLVREAILGVQNALYFAPLVRELSSYAHEFWSLIRQLALAELPLKFVTAF